MSVEPSKTVDDLADHGFIATWSAVRGQPLPTDANPLLWRAHRLEVGEFLCPKPARPFAQAIRDLSGNRHETVLNTVEQHVVFDRQAADNDRRLPMPIRWTRPWMDRPRANTCTLERSVASLIDPDACVANDADDPDPR